MTIIFNRRHCWNCRRAIYSRLISASLLFFFTGHKQRDASRGQPNSPPAEKDPMTAAEYWGPFHHLRPHEMEHTRWHQANPGQSGWSNNATSELDQFNETRRTRDLQWSFMLKDRQQSLQARTITRNNEGDDWATLMQIVAQDGAPESGQR